MNVFFLIDGRTIPVKKHIIETIIVLRNIYDDIVTIDKNNEIIPLPLMSGCTLTTYALLVYLADTNCNKRAMQVLGGCSLSLVCSVLQVADMLNAACVIDFIIRYIELKLLKGKRFGLSLLQHIEKIV